MIAYTLLTNVSALNEIAAGPFIGGPFHGVAQVVGAGAFYLTELLQHARTTASMGCNAAMKMLFEGREMAGQTD
ncbi:hypothetical protein [Leisingera sp. ANG-Vp]|uniref:hypothetical protein n=1 Tax=Leisingera sp. ANG-Vp TaxID=1577896 RepID=UPI00068CFCF0